MYCYSNLKKKKKIQFSLKSYCHCTYFKIIMYVGHNIILAFKLYSGPKLFDTFEASPLLPQISNRFAIKTPLFATYLSSGLMCLHIFLSISLVQLYLPPSTLGASSAAQNQAYANWPTNGIHDSTYSSKSFWNNRDKHIKNKLRDRVIACHWVIALTGLIVHCTKNEAFH